MAAVAAQGIESQGGRQSEWEDGTRVGWSVVERMGWRQGSEGGTVGRRGVEGVRSETGRGGGVGGADRTERLIGRLGCEVGRTTGRRSYGVRRGHYARF